MYKIWQINYRAGTKLLRTLPPLTDINLKSIDKEVSCIYFLELPDSNMIDVGVTNIGELSNKIADAQKFFSNDVVCFGGNPWLMIRTSSLLIPASQAIGIICRLLKDMAQAILSQASD